MKKISKLVDVTKALIFHNLTGKRIPLLVNIQITKHCNLRCKYCYVDFSRITKHPDLTTKQIKQIIDDLCKAGTRWVRLLGGEPLLRRDLEEIIDYINSKDIIIEVVTNGVLLTKKPNIINILKKVDSINVSIDGDKFAQENNRGGNHEDIIRGIQLCIQNKIPIRLHSTLTTYSLNSLPFMVKFAQENGLYFNYAEATIHDKSREYLIPSKKERYQFFRNYLRLKKLGAPITHSEMAIQYLLKWPGGEKFELNQDDFNTGGFSIIPCKEAKLTAYVDVDGMIYPCVRKWGQIGLNYFEVGFEKAWKEFEKMDCVTCKCANHDLSMIFSYNPKVFKLGWNYFINRLKSKIGVK